MQASIAEPAQFGRQCLQPLAQIRVRRPRRLVAHARPIHAQDPARPPLADPVGRLQMLSSLPMRGGRHHFFQEILSATLPNMASANSRFSRPFPSPKAFSLRASETFIPPNLAFHL